MEMVKWSPFQEFADLKREMDQIFDEFFGTRTTMAQKKKFFPVPEGYFPPIDVYKKGEEIIIKAGIPGVNKENINISLLGNTLTIKGGKKKEEKIKNEDYYHVEQYYGSFSRSISLPVEVDPEGMKANYKDGILEVILPKLKKAGTRENKVEIL